MNNNKNEITLFWKCYENMYIFSDNSYKIIKWIIIKMKLHYFENVMKICTYFQIIVSKWIIIKMKFYYFENVIIDNSFK